MMPQDAKTIELRILNTSISVMVNDDNEAKILEITAYVKEKLEQLKQRNPATNMVKLAVLGCMNITEQLFDECQKNLEVTEKYDALDAEFAELSDELEKSKETCNIFMNETAALQAEQKDLQAKRQVLHAELIEKEDLIEKYQEQLQLDKLESAQCRKTMEDFQSEMQRLNAVIQEKDALLEQYWGQFKTAKQETEDVRIQMADLKAEQVQIEMRLNGKDDLLVQSREEMKKLEEEIDTFRKGMADFQAEKDALLAEKDAFLAERQAADAVLADNEVLQEKLLAAKQETEHCRKSVVDLQNQLFETQIELSKWKNK